MAEYGAAAPNANLELGSLFRVEIDGIPSMALEEVTLPESTWGEIPNRTGIDGLKINKSSGLRNAETITFMKKLRVGGVPDVVPILNWYEKGSIDRRNGSIIMANRETQDIIRVNFTGAWVLTRGEVSLNATDEAKTVDFPFTLQIETLTWEAV
jgi:hypothetical protein